MTTPAPRVFHHPAFPKGVDVHPMVDGASGTLNHKLDIKHFHAHWDSLGEEKADPHAGFFPTLESLARREANDPKAPPRDGLGNIRKGLTTHVKVITLTPGKRIFRFTQPAKNGDLSGAFCGPWWTTSLGFENMLARVSATYERSGIGVVGGKGMKLRDYARRYSAVFTDWSEMSRIGMSQVLKPIRCFMGTGAKLTRDDVKVNVKGIELLETETYEDANLQLFLPNLWGHIGSHLSQPRVWTPEAVDALLSGNIQKMRTQGSLLSQRKQHIFEQLMSR